VRNGHLTRVDETEKTVYINQVGRALLESASGRVPGLKADLEIKAAYGSKIRNSRHPKRMLAIFIMAAVIGCRGGARELCCFTGSESDGFHCQVIDSGTG
ncbi:hypothetical protein, partial [Anaerotruncus colihominis]|uniref:hypothetical protein n=1 Tax=Anaerotruncus colihominis TaxID=169435 RepID=UPI00210CD840